LTFVNSAVPDCSWLGNSRREFCDIDNLSNIPPDQKLFNKEELNGRIEACLRIMDLQDKMKEPKRDLNVIDLLHKFRK